MLLGRRCHCFAVRPAIEENALDIGAARSGHDGFHCELAAQNVIPVRRDQQHDAGGHEHRAHEPNDDEECVALLPEMEVLNDFRAVALR